MARANAAIVSSIRRRSQSWSMSEAKTKVSSFSCVQSRPSSLPPRRSQSLDPGSGSGTLKEISASGSSRANESVFSMSATVSPG